MSNDGTPSYTDDEVIALGRSALSTDPDPDPWKEPKPPTIVSKAWEDMKDPFLIGIGAITTLALMMVNVFLCFWFGSLMKQWTDGGDGIAITFAILAVLISITIWWFVLAIVNVYMKEHYEEW